jgi:hypothetical protein
MVIQKTRRLRGLETPKVNVKWACRAEKVGLKKVGRN